MASFSASSLSEDLVIEILQRLTAKSLMRFRCVSKSWCNLIKSPHFINGHYQKQRRNGSMLLLMRYYPGPPDKNGRYHTCLREQDLSFHDLDSPGLKEVSLNLSIPHAPSHPDQTSLYYNEDCLLGPCGGLVCVVLNGNVFICNPALRQFRLLPHCPYTKTANTNPYAKGYFHVVSKRCWAFGTISAAGFKVVQLQSIGSETLDHNGRARKSLIESYMYSSTTNTWRQINNKGKEFPFCGDPRKVCFLNGICHWLIESYETDQSPSAILTCDINSEIIGHLECPDVLRPRYGGSEFLMVLNGCLSIFWYAQQDRPQPCPCEIWVMKEYGVKDSWTKQYLINSGIVGFPVLFWKNDELLQKDRDLWGLSSYDFRTDQRKRFEIDGVERELYALGAVIYKESLRSVN